VVQFTYDLRDTAHGRRRVFWASDIVGPIAAGIACWSAALPIPALEIEPHRAE
jgi:hypothetical protein